MYRCRECDAPAEIVNGDIVRTCVHDGTVVADARVELRGMGGVR